MDTAADSPMQIETLTTTAETSAPQVQLSVTAVSREITAASPGELRFTVENTGSDPVTVRSGPVPPFGPLAARATDRDAGFVLWTDAYEQSEHITQRGDGLMIDDIQYTTEVAAGEQHTHQYLLRADDAASGQYHIMTVGGSSEVLRFGEDTYSVSLQITR